MKRTKTTIILAAIFLGLLGLWFFTMKKNESVETPKESGADERALEVSVKKASDLKSTTSEERLPVVIAADNETVITSEKSGIVSSANFEVGNSIGQGATLVRITDPNGSILSKSGIRSEALRQAEIAVSSARKSYKEAKRLAEKNTNKESYLTRDLARLRLEEAEIALANALDASTVRAPLSGTVSAKFVNVGSSVTPGTALAKIATGSIPKARFHVSERVRNSLALGDSVQILLQENRNETARITSIASNADPTTGKFPIEARFEKGFVSPGTIGSVIIEIRRLASEDSSFFLPLSIITTNQEGSFFFVAENGEAKKISATSIVVSGETGIVSADIPQDTDVIVKSAGTLEDGTLISLK
jgi:membrane fusion protein (multidrug efflux system)